MYETTRIAENIKTLAKSKDIQLKTMLQELALNKNVLSSLYNGSMIKADSLAKIADYLECSVDYLLGRTDNPNITNSISNTNTTVNGTQANVINSNNYNQETVAEQTDEMTAELVKAFRTLSFRDRLDVINLVLEKSNK